MSSASASAPAAGRTGARRARRAADRSRPAPTTGDRRRPAARVRWDRLARMVMLGVLGALLYLYISAGASILATWRSSVAHRAQLGTLVRQSQRLQAQRALLQQPSTIVAEARRLGMVRPGEQAYVVRNLPDR
jgi:cell division protein FtsB